jgi:hypothetical protein
VWVADKTNRENSQTDTDRVVNIMMFDIDQTVAKKFDFDQYLIEGDKDSNGEATADATKRISTSMTKAAGIDQLVPGAAIDARAFEPCGYSMNAILYNSYSTMHITPEEVCSYASFETNAKLTSYHSLINNVVRAFRPKRFVLTMMGDEAGMDLIKDNPLDGRPHKPIVIQAPAKAKPVSPTSVHGAPGAPVEKAQLMSYRRASLASIQIENDTCAMMGNFILDEDDDAVKTRRNETLVVRGMSYS